MVDNTLSVDDIDVHFDIISGQGLIVKDNPSPADYMRMAAFLKNVDQTTTYAWGDLLVSIPAKYGETYNRVCAMSGLSESRIANIKSMCKRIPPHRRPKELTPSHVMVVCDYRVPVEMEDDLLRACVDSASMIGGMWTVKQFRDYVRGKLSLPPANGARTIQDVEEENYDLRRDLDIVSDGYAKAIDALVAVKSVAERIAKTVPTDDAAEIDEILSGIDEMIESPSTMLGIEGRWRIERNGYGVKIFFVEYTEIGDQEYDISRAIPEEALADLSRRLGYGGLT